MRFIPQSRNDHVMYIHGLPDITHMSILNGSISGQSLEFLRMSSRMNVNLDESFQYYVRELEMTEP